MFCQPVAVGPPPGSIDEYCTVAMRLSLSVTVLSTVAAKDESRPSGPPEPPVSGRVEPVR